MKKEPQVPKFELIKGGKTRNESNIRFLMGVLKEGNTPLTQSQYVSFAYHFAINGDTISARKFLNKVESFYFSVGIYKDLYRALLYWSIRDTIWNPTTQKQYEYFIVVKKSLDVFTEFEFIAKKEFMEFRSEFLKETTVIQ